MELEEKVVELAEKLEQLVVQLAEPTAEIVLNTARVSAGQEVLFAVVVVIVTVIYIKILISAFKAAEEYDAEHSYADRTFVVGLLGGGIGIGLALLNATVTFKVWGWVGIFYPELYLAHKLLGL